MDSAYPLPDSVESLRTLIKAAYDKIEQLTHQDLAPMIQKRGFAVTLPDVASGFATLNTFLYVNRDDGKVTMDRVSQPAWVASLGYDVAEFNMDQVTKESVSTHWNTGIGSEGVGHLNYTNTVVRTPVAIRVWIHFRQRVLPEPPWSGNVLGDYHAAFDDASVGTDCLQAHRVCLFVERRRAWTMKSPYMLMDKNTLKVGDCVDKARDEMLEHAKRRERLEAFMAERARLDAIADKAQAERTKQQRVDGLPPVSESSDSVKPI